MILMVDKLLVVAMIFWWKVTADVGRADSGAVGGKNEVGDGCFWWQG